MRKLFVATFILAGLGLPALAAEDFGTVESINAEARTIVVNGETYTLNGEFDIGTLERGTEVALTYEEADGKKMVQDIIIDEEVTTEEQ
ncbi:DUF1344 domain-containing protein [Limoniibacter endophyticus]|uniref:DUF5666 domain-containing protein n=1 Tax=Limoniibacter endophyticus TaxID=1565040 RepID=A0A8J3DHI9_9HYPH|nr:DUF1344 domain-containing protein [Limoniibacter endophyticus]GHC71445.1 hypothetical protein GCM10010136_18640 [Limoniibacter endophyticus]